MSNQPASGDDVDLIGADYSAPERSCDIVMKGGITSGVVYPLAVCELARTYRFRNIGGTSAGAIAAAATAAAEYGRAEGGFNELAKLPDWLGEGKNLQNLFQPQRRTRRLFRVLLASVDRRWKAVPAALWNFPLAVIAGALPTLILVALALEGTSSLDSDALQKAATVISILIGLVFLLAGVSLAIIARMAFAASRALPGNGFGLCSGMGGNGGDPALTPWLEEKLDEYAGAGDREPGEPLTFGHLWAGPGKGRQNAPGDKRWLQLAMMTTNLTNRRAHQLPWDSREWFFDPREFRRLFPEDVVKWMEDRPAEPPGDCSAEEAREIRVHQALMRPLLPLPAPADLPVLVTTRMSLSFPVLLSAVPLWSLDTSSPDNKVLTDWRQWAADQEEGWKPPAGDVERWPRMGQPEPRPQPERCWFSDGGISSNFPIHFFDRLIPRWPTFAINLRPFPPWQEPSSDEEANTTMVEANDDGIAEWWYRLPAKGGLLRNNRLVQFLASVGKTMQNRVDEAQMRVPGFRDRVSHVSMTKKEGGMNLTMPRSRIEALTSRGRFAARRLKTAYTRAEGEDEAITWDNHRWLRLRSSLAVLEEMHQRFANGYGTDPERLSHGERRYVELVRRGDDDPPGGYRWEEDEQRTLAEKEIEAIEAAVRATDGGRSVVPGAPEPTPIGRIVPRD